MNMLNQIIIEGTVKETEVKECNGLKVASLNVETKRDYRRFDGTVETEVTMFETRCYGNMTDVVEKNANKNRGIRLVGRLKQETWLDGDRKRSKIVIIAEHLEFKPQLKESKNAD